MDETIGHQRHRGVLARLGSALHAVSALPPDPPESLRGGAEPSVSRRHQDAVAVLTAARIVIRRGSARRAWYLLEAPAGRRRILPAVFPGHLDRTRVAGACLVGAVLHAAWQQSPRPEHAYPAVDALWHTLLDAGDRGGTTRSVPSVPRPYASCGSAT